MSSSLQSFYRKGTATSKYLGDEVFTVNWAWLAVSLVFAFFLLIAGAISVAVEFTVAAKVASGGAGKDGAARQHLFELRLPKAYSTYNSDLRSTWGKGVMHDMETAAGVGHYRRIYG